MENYLTSCDYVSGNNIYGDAVRETLLKLQKAQSKEDAAYILMQRIFPTIFGTIFMRSGGCHKDHAISELGIYGTYLRYIVWLHMNYSYMLSQICTMLDNEGLESAGIRIRSS